jgi:hypothetical protein
MHDTPERCSRPDRAKTRTLSVHVDTELYDAFKAAQQAHGTTTDAMLTKAVVLLLEDLCEPVPKKTQRKLAALDAG